MSKYMERAKELRNSQYRHYNCAQAVLIPFAEEKGLSEEAAFALTDNYGSGMKMGSVCGAIAGGLMVLGLYGINDTKTITEYYRTIRANHDGKIMCADLLAMNKEKGGSRKEHCDSMVYEAVAAVEKIISSEN